MLVAVLGGDGEGGGLGECFLDYQIQFLQFEHRVSGKNSELVRRPILTQLSVNDRSLPLLPQDGQQPCP